jgi:hypothetical protein
MANQKSLDSLYNYIQSKRSSGHSYNGIPVYDVTKSDIDKLGQIADKYGIPVEWLGNLINHESAGTFNPAIQNRTTSATGLIQFMPRTAAGSPYNTTVDYLKTLNFSQQLDYVDMYLGKNLKRVFDETGKVKPTFNQTDLFMTIFYPVSVGNPNYLFPEKVQNQNGGIKTPIDYTQKALRNPPFSLEEFPSSLSDFLKKFGSKDGGGEGTKKKGKGLFIVGSIIGLGIISFAIYKIVKMRKK